MTIENLNIPNNDQTDDNEDSNIEVTENRENNTQRVIKKKLIIKAKKKPDFDFSKYGKRRKSRIYAMFALYSYDMNHKEITLDELIEFSYEDSKIPDSVLNFAKEIIEGTIKNIDAIDEIITASSENWRFSRIQYVDKAILRMSIYALLFQKDISKSIVIDEALEISKIFSDKDSYKFINGILDAIQT